MTDFTKKLLIYVSDKDLKPTGGAAGYNYNLNRGLQIIGAKNYEYLSGVDNTRNRIKSLKESRFKRILFVFLRMCNYYQLLHKRHSYAKVNLNEYDVVHFHNVKDMYEARSSLVLFKGIVVLTSHSPKPFSMEIYEDIISDFERGFLGKMYKKLIIMEKYAFSRADILVFPCEEAEEPYYLKWKDYQKVHNNNKSKYRYILTGTTECKVKIDRVRYREKYEIPTNALVISYVGRHNVTKGYDQLIEIGKRALINDNTYIIVAGKQGPLNAPKLSKWIEIGWTNDPHSLINASDIFVLPNKETYFDLVMLEVLSLGKIVVASATGGNKFFEKINTGGIFLYSSIEEAISIIDELRLMDSAKREELETKNKLIFEKYFSEVVFAEKYIELINSL